MMDEIRLYGDDALRTVADDVPDFDGELRKLAERLLAVQAREKAIGVAAVQIGIARNLFSLDAGAIRRGGRTEVLVNPQVIAEEGEVVEEEGCLSFPDVFCDVVRPRWVAITACDLDGNPVEREADGMLARAYLHEIDHLQGRLFIDRVDPETRERILAKMQSLTHRR